MSYSPLLRSLHWLQAAGTIGTFAAVQAALNTEDKKDKKKLMDLHKSLAVLVIGVTPFRIAARLTSKVPPPLEGSQLEVLAGKAAHYAMYACMISLPISGSIMGYYSGFGVPFFGLFKIPGASKENVDKEMSKKAYDIHKAVGQAFEYLFVAHLAGTAFHISKGQSILSRMLFASK